MKNPEGRPSAVRRLIQETARDNPDAIQRHRNMSRKGGKAAAESNRLRRKQQQEEDTLRTAMLVEDVRNAAAQTAETLYTESEEGDILPPDPKAPQ